MPNGQAFYKQRINCVNSQVRANNTEAFCQLCIFILIDLFIGAIDKWRRKIFYVIMEKDPCVHRKGEKQTSLNTWIIVLRDKKKNVTPKRLHKVTNIGGAELLRAEKEIELFLII